MAEPAEDLELMIDAYLDGRLDSAQRARFEERLSREPELKQKVEEATRSMEMVQKALGWVTPGEEFDTKVNSKIISITSGNLKPALPSSPRSLTKDDPDARLLEDPAASQEKRRLIVLAVVGAAFFLGAICLAVFLLTRGVGR